MCDYPYATDFLAPLPAWPIDYSCNLLLDMPDDPLAGLAAAAGLFYNGTGTIHAAVFFSWGVLLGIVRTRFCLE